MDRLSPELALRKIRMRELPPEIQLEVQELSKELHYEGTIKSSSSLQFLYELYQAQKEKKDEKALKRAEKMIMSLATLSHARVSGAKARKKTEKRARMAPVSEAEMALSQKIRGAFLQMGIKDENFMRKALGLLGEAEVIDRSELVLATKLEKKTRKSLFRKHPEILLVPRQDLFAKDLEIIEKKREIFDMMREIDAIPEGMDYKVDSSALLMSSRDIMDFLKLDAGEPVPESGESEGGLPTLTRRQFVKRMKQLGFEKRREVRHGAFFTNPDTGKTIMIQNTHSQGTERYVETGILRRKLKEAGVSVKQFNEA